MALTLERRIGTTHPVNLAEVAGGRTNRHRAPMLPWVHGPDPRGRGTARLQPVDGESRLFYNSARKLRETRYSHRWSGQSSYPPRMRNPLPPACLSSVNVCEAIKLRVTAR